MSSELFALGIKQFNQQQFYECHDTFEAIWIEAIEIDKRFYQGILQIAVACYHLSELNLRGAMILLGEGISRLNDYQPDYQNVYVTELLVDSDLLLKTLQLLTVENLTEFVENLFDTKENATKNTLNCQLPKISIVDG